MEPHISFDPAAVPSPSFVVDEELLERNLRLLNSVQTRTGCRVLMALKGFAMWSVFPLARQYLSGAAASSLNEATLARREMNKEVHVYAPAYSDEEFPKLLELADHMVFNSVGQWRRFRPVVQDYMKRTGRTVECGLRVNPGYSEVKVELYNPAAPKSRLGTPADHITEADLNGLSGLHFHVMCEQNSDVLVRCLSHFEEKFGKYLPRLKWVNFGGGHHVTRPDYDVDLLCETISSFQQRHGVQVIIEPGEAIALNTGYLVATVLDLFHHAMDIAILDTSATAHMPDVLEMPYRPHIIGGALPGEKPHTYRLGGLTCLAGDVIGDWSFERPLQVGDRLVFTDMAHYTMVKTTMFNGVHHPSIVLRRRDGSIHVQRQFGYEDFKGRLS